MSYGKVAPKTVDAKPGEQKPIMEAMPKEMKKSLQDKECPSRGQAAGRSPDEGCDKSSSKA